LNNIPIDKIAKCYTFLTSIGKSNFKKNYTYTVKLSV